MHSGEETELLGISKWRLTAAKTPPSRPKAQTAKAVIFVETMVKR
jgi:hypothetical protein